MIDRKLVKGQYVALADNLSSLPHTAALWQLALYPPVWFQLSGKARVVHPSLCRLMPICRHLFLEPTFFGI